METITGAELAELCDIYYSLISELPEDLRIRKNLPSFERFLSPANWSMLPDTSNFEFLDISAYIEFPLSITGVQRCALLRSPHKTALFRAYIAANLL